MCRLRTLLPGPAALVKDSSALGARSRIARLPAQGADITMSFLEIAVFPRLPAPGGYGSLACQTALQPIGLRMCETAATWAGEL